MTVDRRKILNETKRIVNLRIRYCHKYLQILKENNRKFVYRKTAAKFVSDW
jgi:hypothetical protein